MNDTLRSLVRGAVVATSADAGWVLIRGEIVARYPTGPDDPEAVSGFREVADEIQDVAREALEASTAVVRELDRGSSSMPAATFLLVGEPFCRTDRTTAGALVLSIPSEDEVPAEDLATLEAFASMADRFLDACAAGRKDRDTLEEEAHRYRLLEDGNDPFFFFRHDADHRFTYLSPGVENVLGYRPEELVGHRYNEILVDSPYVAMTHERTEAALRSGSKGELYRTLVTRKDGQEALLEIIETPVTGGDGTLELQGCARDVTYVAAIEEDLRQRLATEEALARVAAIMMRHEPCFDEVLSILGQMAGASRAYLFRVSEDGEVLSNTHEWCAEGVSPQIDELPDLPADAFPWWMEQLGGGSPLHIPDVSKMPPAAEREREALEAKDIRSFIVVPVMARDAGLLGFMGFDDTAARRAWAPEDVRVLQTVAKMLASELERREHLKALRSNEERLRLALKAGNMGIWEVTLPEEHLTISRQAAELYSLSPEEVDGDSDRILQRIHPEDRDHLIAVVKQAMARGEPYQVQYRVAVPDGGVRWVESSGKPVMDADGCPVSLIGLSTDITRRKEMEREIRESEAYFRTLIESGVDLIGVFEPDGATRYLSPGYARLLQYPQEDLLLMDFGSLVHSDDLDDARDLFRTVAGESGTRGEAEVRMVASDGQARTLRVVISNMLDVPEVQGLVLNGQDITNQRFLEEQLRQAQKMEAVGRLAGGIAHDFNNLLTVIHGLGTFLLNESPSDDLEQIVQSAERGTQLTRQLLQFSRQHAVMPEVLDVRAELVDTGRLLHRLLGENIEFTVHLPEDDERIEMDPGHFQQILMNLMVNARDALDGAGEIVLEAAGVKVEREITGVHDRVPPGSYVELRVRDTGEGIPADVLPHIFEPFFTTKDELGTGLGLATVFGIVKQGGGFVLVDSQAGSGATFRVFLPRVTEPVQPRLKDPVPPAEGAGETVLLAEDDPSVRSVLARMLEHLGYRVLVASDGAEALNIGLEEPDLRLVLSDVVMPALQGPEMAARLCEQRPEVPVILMSGHTPGQHDTEIPPGVRQYLPKPIELDTLRDAVGGVLRRH